MAIREEKEIKGIQTLKEVKLCFQVYSTKKNPKDATKKLLALIDAFGLHSYTLTMKDQKEKLRT